MRAVPVTLDETARIVLARQVRELLGAVDAIALQLSPLVEGQDTVFDQRYKVEIDAVLQLHERMADRLTTLAELLGAPSVAS